MAGAVPSADPDHPYYNTYVDLPGDPSQVFGFLLNICTDGVQRKAYKQCRNEVTFAQVSGRWVDLNRTAQTVTCKMCDRNGRSDIFVEPEDMGTIVRNLMNLDPEVTTVVFTVTTAPGVRDGALRRDGDAEPAAHSAQAQAGGTSVPARNAFQAMMSPAREFPEKGSMNGFMPTGRPAQLKAHVLRIMKTDMGLLWRRSERVDVVRMVKAVCSLLWKMDRCGAWTKIGAAGFKKSLPLHFKLVTHAQDEKGRSGGSHKSKNASDHKITAQMLDEWKQATDAICQRPVLEGSGCVLLMSELHSLSNVLAMYRARVRVHCTSRNASRVQVRLGSGKELDEVVSFHGVGDLPPKYNWLRGALTEGLPRGPVRITDALYKHGVRGSTNATKHMRDFIEALAWSAPLYTYQRAFGGSTRQEVYLFEASKGNGYSRGFEEDGGTTGERDTRRVLYDDGGQVVGSCVVHGTRSAPSTPRRASAAQRVTPSRTGERDVSAATHGGDSTDSACVDGGAVPEREDAARGAEENALRRVAAPLAQAATEDAVAPGVVPLTSREAAPLRAMVQDGEFTEAECQHRAEQLSLGEATQAASDARAARKARRDPCGDRQARKMVDPALIEGLHQVREKCRAFVDLASMKTWVRKTKSLLGTHIDTVTPSQWSAMYALAVGKELAKTRGSGLRQEGLYNQLTMALQSEDPAECVDRRKLIRDDHTDVRSTWVDYADFWLAGRDLIEAHYAAASRRRHGDGGMVSTDGQPVAISLRDLRNQVAAKCREKWPPPNEVKYPSEWLMARQFVPPNRGAVAAGRYTGFFGVKHVCVKNTLRNHNKDSGYCMQLKDHQHWLAKYLGPRTCHLVQLDDKCTVVCGNPGSAECCVANARGAFGSSVGRKCVQSLDHSCQQRSRLIPSVALHMDISGDEQSMYRGVVEVTLKEGLSQPSTAMRHITELVNSLKRKYGSDPKGWPAVLLLGTDGGPDHHFKNLTVKHALVSVFLQLDLDMLDARRCAAGQSYTQEVERIMSILNLAWQGLGIARNEMEDEFESSIKNLSTSKKIREEFVRDPRLRVAWMAAHRDVIAVMERFAKRMELKGVPFEVASPATEEQVQDSLDVCSVVDDGLPAIAAINAKELRKFVGLTKFLADSEHVRSTMYGEAYMKCKVAREGGECKLGVCKPGTRVPAEKVLKWSEQPMRSEGQNNKSGQRWLAPGSTYANGNSNETHRPSWVPAQITQEVETCVVSNCYSKRYHVKCSNPDCKRLRLVYTTKRVQNEGAMEDALHQLVYVCGDALPRDLRKDEFAGAHPLVARPGITCTNTMETQVYTTRYFDKGTCYHCGEAGATVEPGLHETWINVYPVCSACRGKGRKEYCRRKRRSLQGVAARTIPELLRLATGNARPVTHVRRQVTVASGQGDGGSSSGISGSTRGTSAGSGPAGAVLGSNGGGSSSRGSGATGSGSSGATNCGSGSGGNSAAPRPGRSDGRSADAGAPTRERSVARVRPGETVVSAWLSQGRATQRTRPGETGTPPAQLYYEHNGKRAPLLQFAHAGASKNAAGRTANTKYWRKMPAQVPGTGQKYRDQTRFFAHEWVQSGNKFRFTHAGRGLAEKQVASTRAALARSNPSLKLEEDAVSDASPAQHVQSGGAPAEVEPQSRRPHGGAPSSCGGRTVADMFAKTAQPRPQRPHDGTLPGQCVDRFDEAHRRSAEIIRDSCDGSSSDGSVDSGSDSDEGDGAADRLAGPVASLPRRAITSIERTLVPREGEGRGVTSGDGLKQEQPHASPAASMPSVGPVLSRSPAQVGGTCCVLCRAEFDGVNKAVMFHCGRDMGCTSRACVECWCKEEGAKICPSCGALSEEARAEKVLTFAAVQRGENAQVALAQVPGPVTLARRKARAEASAHAAACATRDVGVLYAPPAPSSQDQTTGDASARRAPGPRPGPQPAQPTAPPACSAAVSVAMMVECGEDRASPRAPLEIGISAGRKRKAGAALGAPDAALAAPPCPRISQGQSTGDASARRTPRPGPEPEQPTAPPACSAAVSVATMVHCGEDRASPRAPLETGISAGRKRKAGAAFRAPHAALAAPPCPRISQGQSTGDASPLSVGTVVDSGEDRASTGAPLEASISVGGERKAGGALAMHARSANTFDKPAAEALPGQAGQAAQRGNTELVGREHLDEGERLFSVLIATGTYTEKDRGSFFDEDDPGHEWDIDTLNEEIFGDGDGDGHLGAAVDLQGEVMLSAPGQGLEGGAAVAGPVQDDVVKGVATQPGRTSARSRVQFNKNTHVDRSATYVGGGSCVVPRVGQQWEAKYVDCGSATWLWGTVQSVNTLESSVSICFDVDGETDEWKYPQADLRKRR